MMMPALLPKELAVYATNDKEEGLFHALQGRLSDFALFFDYACDDETWSSNHSSFMRQSVHWLTKQAFQGQLSRELLHQVSRSIRSHYGNLRSVILNDLVLKLNETSIPASSLLYSASSSFFQELIHRECFDKKIFKLDFGGVSYHELFRFVDEFVNTEDVVDLWKNDQEKLLEILKYAVSIQLGGLARLCEDVLSRYIDAYNVYTFLALAQKNGLIHLIQTCLKVLNQIQNDATFLLVENEQIACFFQAFSEKTLDVFEKTKGAINQLAFSDECLSNSMFAQVVQGCPNITKVTFSHSAFMPEQLTALPRSLSELNLDSCEWLSPATLRMVIDACPHLIKLSLASNVQLTSRAWGELMRCSTLSFLDLARCQQLRDEDFKIVLHAGASLTDLNLEDCKSIGERGFFDLSRVCSKLTTLNVSRTNLSDASLIEIVTKCRSLRTLNLTRCEQISDRGVIEAIRHGHSLKQLYLTNCHISANALEEGKRLNPNLQILM